MSAPHLYRRLDRLERRDRGDVFPEVHRIILQPGEDLAARMAQEGIDPEEIEQDNHIRLIVRQIVRPGDLENGEYNQ